MNIAYNVTYKGKLWTVDSVTMVEYNDEPYLSILLEKPDCFLTLTRKARNVNRIDRTAEVTLGKESYTLMYNGVRKGTKRNARAFCDAIRKLAGNEYGLSSLEDYLSEHFDFWLKKIVSSPDQLVKELRNFADLY